MLRGGNNGRISTILLPLIWCSQNPLASIFLTREVDAGWDTYRCTVVYSNLMGSLAGDFFRDKMQHICRISAHVCLAMARIT